MLKGAVGPARAFHMTGLLTIVAVGLFLGMRHATDPDHVIAVSTMLSGERSIPKAVLIGVLWGCGHTLTIVLVGAAIISFGLAMPARLGLSMEFSVGLMLILLGVLNLTGVMNRLTVKFAPGGAKINEQHAHSHWLRTPATQLGSFYTLRPLLVGVVHGLAGSAAIALLVLSTIRDLRWAVLYLLVFGVGTIVGMMLITAAIALPFSFARAQSPGFNQGLMAASGILSLAFGIFICCHIGLVNGLFTNHPKWIPS